MRRRIKSERGAALLEAAITIPMLLLVSVGIFEFGRAYQTWQILTNAAREGARIAVLPGYTAADVQDRVTQYVRQGIGDNTVTPTVVLTPVSIDPPGATPAFPAAQVTVTMTHTYLLMGPVSGLLGGGSWSSITLAARSTMRIES
jgi:Flp pilus assembly protein TadG